MRYIKISSRDVEVGMHIRSRETYPSGSTITYEGVIDGIHEQGNGWKVAYLAGVPRINERDPGDVEKIELWQVLPPLPTTLGSVVLDRSGRTAVLRGEVDEPDGVWVWSDNGEPTGPVLGDVEIIHEARR